MHMIRWAACVPLCALGGLWDRGTHNHPWKSLSSDATEPNGAYQVARPWLVGVRHLLRFCQARLARHCIVGNPFQHGWMAHLCVSSIALWGLGSLICHWLGRDRFGQSFIVKASSLTCTDILSHQGCCSSLAVAGL